jgi:hypothetical protein
MLLPLAACKKRSRRRKRMQLRLLCLRIPCPWKRRRGWRRCWQR